MSTKADDYKEYPIHDTVIAPARAKKAAAKPKFGLHRLEVSKVKDGELHGQSVFIAKKIPKEVSVAIYKEAKRENITVAIRGFSDGVRVYRVEKQKK